MPSITSRRLLLVSIATLTLLGISFEASPPALAASCSFNASTRVATAVSSPSGTTYVQRSGDTIRVGHADNWHNCGTVTELNKLDIDMNGSSGTALVIQLEYGAFAPGFTSETDGTSEIEMVVTNAQNSGLVEVQGTPAGDHITIGYARIQLQDANVFNVNAGVEATPDNDVSVLGSAPLVGVGGREGNDKLFATGTGSVGSGPTRSATYLSDGVGADEVVGGDGQDWFVMTGATDPGDSYSGEGGEDRLTYYEDNRNLGVSLDGVPNDGADCPGASCEGDNVAPSIEVIETGSGDDTLIGTDKRQVLDPGSGENEVHGMRGRDTLLLGGAGGDDASGGPGIDTASYVDHLAGVVVTLDSAPNDGAGGTEGDNVRKNVEIVKGTPLLDLLSGNDKANKLVGAGGNDFLRGLSGRDRLLGNLGDDDLSGGPGTDTCKQGPGTGTKASCER